MLYSYFKLSNIIIINNSHYYSIIKLVKSHQMRCCHPLVYFWSCFCISSIILCRGNKYHIINGFLDKQEIIITFDALKHHLCIFLLGNLVINTTLNQLVEVNILLHIKLLCGNLKCRKPLCHHRNLMFSYVAQSTLKLLAFGLWF